MRDWIFSRQRYWGEPIPIIHCDACGEVRVPEADLPVLLPHVERYEPTGTGDSPLAAITEWLQVACPTCGGPATRETDTMPQWAGSCWYFLRYASPDCDTALVAPDAVRDWLPVNLYVGGIEHAILHLLYARFFVKFLHDIDAVPFDEPFARLFQPRHDRAPLRDHRQAGEDVQIQGQRGQPRRSGRQLRHRFGTPLRTVHRGRRRRARSGATGASKGMYRFLRRAWNWVLGATPDADGTTADEVARPLHVMLRTSASG